jgi:GWxTD domain-containing protein
MLRLLHYFRTFFYLGFLIVFLWGCKPLSQLGTSNLSKLYSVKGNPMGYSTAVYHLNDSISQAILRFPYSDLAFKPARQGDKSSHRVLVSYRLLSSIQQSNPCDSSSFTYSDSLQFPPSYFISGFTIKAKTGSYVLQSEVTDLVSGEKYLNLVPFSKMNRSEGSWFRIEGEKSGILLDNYIDSDEAVRLITCDTSIRTLTCRAFYKSFPAAIPPFVEKERVPFDYRFDSSFTLKLQDGKSGFVRFPRQGFYYFQSDTSGTEGITLFRFYPGYPKINSPKRMLEALRYITASKEFEQMLAATYPKETVDSFWVATTGGPDRAVELIREYYGRVEEANRFFQSYTEGWKTDRGIIYIIFGPPNLVYRSDEQETWTYGEANNYHSIRFMFYKVLNPFTANDYILQRQYTYKDIWYNAIQQWRR